MATIDTAPGPRRKRSHPAARARQVAALASAGVFGGLGVTIAVANHAGASDTPSASSTSTPGTDTVSANAAWSAVASNGSASAASSYAITGGS